jgi:hypothetical protein
MPVRRRQSKRRLDPAAEVRAWAELFEVGYDFFGDLEPLGFDGRQDSDRAAREAAPEAWRRLGAAFLAQRELTAKVPWALEQFGMPSEVRRAR